VPCEKNDDSSTAAVLYAGQDMSGSDRPSDKVVAASLGQKSPSANWRQTTRPDRPSLGAPLRRGSQCVKRAPASGCKARARRSNLGRDFDLAVATREGAMKQRRRCSHSDGRAANANRGCALRVDRSRSPTRGRRIACPRSVAWSLSVCEGLDALSVPP